MRPGMRRRARPILGVDIDNVLAQSDACLRAMFQELYGITLEEQQMTRYDYMTYGVTEEQLVQVFRVFNVRKCRTLKVVPGAKAALARLARRYEICLVTSRNPESKAGTEYWLRAKGLPYDQLHFNDDKHTSMPTASLRPAPPSICSHALGMPRRSRTPTSAASTPGTRFWITCYSAPLSLRA